MDEYNTILNQLNGLLKNWDGPEASVAVHQTCKKLYTEACRTVQGQRHARLEESARIISRAFTAAITDRQPHNDKRAKSIPIATTLFKLYSRLGTTRLCANITRALDSAADVALTASPDTCEYLYWRGRIYLDLFNAACAAQKFQESFQMAMSRQCLLYSVVTRMAVDRKLPSKWSFQSGFIHSALMLVVQAVKEGNVVHLDRALDAHRQFWMHKKLYLFMSIHLRSVCLRNLLIMVVHGVETRVSVVKWWAACRLRVDKDMSMEEAEALLASLIYQGVVRGYVSREHRVLVLSKKNPFP